MSSCFWAEFLKTNACEFSLTSFKSDNSRTQHGFCATSGKEILDGICIRTMDAIIQKVEDSNAKKQRSDIEL